MKNKKHKIIIMSIMLLMVFPLVGCTKKTEKQADDNLNITKNESDKIKLVMYKSPSCGCCTGHAGVLEKDGYEVEVKISEEMDSIKNKYNIPSEMRSCHTIVVGDYFIEGHVPTEAIEKLLAEQPDIDGIALPRMPAGSPGMPGQKREPFKVFQLNDGEYSEFMTI